MTLQVPARLHRGIVCAAALFFLTTIFLAATRIASSVDFSIRRRPSAQDAPRRSPADAPMSYGSTARPGFTDLAVHIASLPGHHVPSRANPRHRLVIVGDVHGMRASLDRLLEELRFDTAKGDHLVLAGDMINKGPDSRGVVDLAMQLGASAVRGNHEDRVLLAHRSMGMKHVADEDAHGNPVATREEEETKAEGQTTEDAKPEAQPASDNDAVSEPEQDDLEPAIFPHGDSRERATARALSRKHLDWLSTLPVILDVGTVENLGNLVVVHAGLVPGLSLKQQDPWAVMNMRGLVYPREELRREEAKKVLEEYRKTHYAAGAAGGAVTESMIEREHERRRKPDDRKIAIPTDRRDGASSWPKAWNAHQKALPEGEPRTAVAYGHDSKKGLNINTYTFGLDSGCVNGGELTALVIEATPEGVTHVVKSVKCDKDQGKKAKKHKKSKKHEARS
ncbi:bis(5'-nucleosyl)-tetraphosphatase, symmetrical [Colletotrichum spaethianum]|uniref:Bis(5'-nucleosyl)-tetraphosphatase, symmetrical n=1 Tax=Colletotrichum spaethianum TaxID=700344 RepID=A0AA37LAZ6_9PEZI|nr:bis(5'-nucleosyl)-tetraphosphatase, symmetrical [Colletotrichum spaethianum]GKT42655.1 bis(5'-nucleosyl)-tetraphosphatase, symmetrical [Colletotrichum spaethianum]